MNQEFDLARNVYLDRDDQGVVRQLLHLDAPFVSRSRTPQLAAADYLHQFGDLLGLPAEQLQSLGSSPSSGIENAPVELRFLTEKSQFDTATVAFYQTDLGLPVWQAGVAIQMKLNPFRILSSQSTQHPNLNVKPPSAEAAKHTETLQEDELARLLGIEKQSKTEAHADRGSLKIENRLLVIYRYESAKRLPPARTAEPSHGLSNGQPKGQAVTPTSLPSLPLPIVPRTVQEGQHYVALKVDFALSVVPFGLLHWVAIIDVETLAVLYLRAFVDDVNGLVFEDDPITTNGGPLPSATSAGLNPVRVSRLLPGLAAPVSGTQALTGDAIQMSDAETPTIAPPTEPAGTDFSFDARTDNFAAVNAYYHCDKFFRLTDGMGFTRASYFGGTTFPTVADHRGHFGTTSGIEINAHCVGTSGGAGIARTTFMLADTGDTTNPIGLACDYRVVLHELGGHGTLYNHVHSANFGFAHSAGDSVAAILNDPGSQAADRFLTFPWIALISRRHDRTPAAGWGWAGSIALNPFSPSLDSGGYNNEQILSTTHFRIYRSIGGDSADLALQQFAARHIVYLILRAIASLTPATNPASAAGFASALITADLGDWVSEGLTGGAYGKVIRWAFEKQGLYQPSGTATPNNTAGAPPPVDIYIDDGRAGEYPYQANFWSNQSIWNRTHSDGGTTHQDPIVGQTNYGYVKVKNRGTQNATGVTVKAFHANPAAGLSYPNDWIPMTTTQLSAADVAANNGAEITVGPFLWTPTHIGHECMFMIVSAAGDASNAGSIAAGDSIPEWRLVPNDNNIGQRNVAPVAGTGTSGLTASFKGLTFQLKNPGLTTARMEVRPVLPALLEARGWRIEFQNAGGASFPLRAGDSREIIMRLIPGRDFTSSDVANTDDKTIHLQGYADGILVGGMSYQLDPNLEAETGSHHGGECRESAATLLQCVKLNPEKVRRVHVRRVMLDVDFDEECLD